MGMVEEVNKTHHTDKYQAYKWSLASACSGSDDVIPR